MPKVIRLGDSTSKGGVVTTAYSPYRVGGIAVARVGDKCSCHKDCVIVEGSDTFRLGGIAVAFEGHKTSCGAVLQASSAEFGQS